VPVGTSVTIPYRGSLVRGKVLRYDTRVPGREYYVIDTGDGQPLVAPYYRVKQEEA
jgi:hypothetical protein